MHVEFEMFKHDSKLIEIFFVSVHSTQYILFIFFFIFFNLSWLYFETNFKYFQVSLRKKLSFTYVLYNYYHY